MKKLHAALAAAAIALAGSPVAQADIPPMPQGYPIENLYRSCTGSEQSQWRYGETARRYLSDGVLEFKNTTSQTVKYKAEVESGTNHEISANSRAHLPSGWNTTAKADIGLTTDNGWIAGETFGPIELAPGESFRVEFGVLEKDFISMYVGCKDGFFQNMAGADVVRGTGPAERYAFATIVRADGNVDHQALDIPARAEHANSKPVGGTYNAVTGPSLEKVADPKNDQVVVPETTPQKDPSWPEFGSKCDTPYPGWYPHEIHAITPTFRKPGYSQDFLNWSSGPHTYTPMVDHVVGAQFNSEMNYRGNGGRLPEGWLESVGAAQRAYLPVGTPLKPLELQPGDRVRVEYGTTMMRVQFSEYSCGKDKTYSRVAEKPVATAPAGFWAEAKITSKDGSVRTVDVTPDEWANLPVPTQTNY
ncbi:hypothetical protein [Corynebacterium sp. H130]|uniref:hypothetical protein n=1 Tax=Corynebacterium sp. H130 TaxID=3133444 RepID=UPI0030B573A9